ncbi:ATP-binding protein [Corynebacterium vitaeruminis]|uniref:ATP-binding protein n=1 Tax=Corynebacterium vitaeruminis TaxID=38305 RepID=UPI00054D3E6D|nr:ATP-binding protein [Corynebacterium vitaeruminis]
MTQSINVAPSASRLTRSLRDVGYSFESAIADLVDNSIAAGATSVWVEIHFDGRSSTISISDNGSGMDEHQLDEAMRFGSKRTYSTNELGRYGLGLKTASLSQCRRFEVASLTSDGDSAHARALDLDFIEATDDWVILDTSDDIDLDQLGNAVHGDHGTKITWMKLDRVLPSKGAEGGWARRRFERIEEKLRQHLSMVFHRFLEEDAENPVKIFINDEPIESWDPFATAEPATEEFSSNSFEVEQGDFSGVVRLRTYLLPTRERFSSPESFDEAAGPGKWNKQQGIYIYRANRLVQWGGWSGIRAIDEHTKFARAALDFDTTLDEAFNINVAKMRVTLPSQLKKMLARPLNELCLAAGTAYRKSNLKTESVVYFEQKSLDSAAMENIGISLKSAAARTGHFKALQEIADLLKKESPELVKLLGF